MTDPILADEMRHQAVIDRLDAIERAIEFELEWLKTDNPFAIVGAIPVDCPTCGQRLVQMTPDFKTLRFYEDEIYCDACFDLEMREVALANVSAR